MEEQACKDRVGLPEIQKNRKCYVNLNVGRENIVFL
jgi:hypothetical protein